MPAYIKADREKYYKRSKRISIITMIILIICMILIYFIWAMSDATVPNNRFVFGTVDVEVGYYDNDAEMYYGTESTMFNEEINYHYINPSECLSQKMFFVRNKGNVDAYFRVYFENISGKLGNIVAVRIKSEDGKTLLADIPANDMIRDYLNTIDDPKNGIIGKLAAGEKQNMIIELVMTDVKPENPQNLSLEFDLCVEAVQVQNNELQNDGGEFN